MRFDQWAIGGRDRSTASPVFGALRDHGDASISLLNGNIARIDLENPSAISVRIGRGAAARPPDRPQWAYVRIWATSGKARVVPARRVIRFPGTQKTLPELATTFGAA